MCVYHLLVQQSERTAAITGNNSATLKDSLQAPGLPRSPYYPDDVLGDSPLTLPVTFPRLLNLFPFLSSIPSLPLLPPIPLCLFIELKVACTYAPVPRPLSPRASPLGNFSILPTPRHRTRPLSCVHIIAGIGCVMFSQRSFQPLNSTSAQVDQKLAITPPESPFDEEDEFDFGSGLVTVW